MASALFFPRWIKRRDAYIALRPAVFCQSCAWVGEAFFRPELVGLMKLFGSRGSLSPSGECSYEHSWSFLTLYDVMGNYPVS